MVSPIRADIPLLPITYPVMSKYSLIGQDNNPYVNIELDLYLLTLQSQSSGFKDLMSVINFASSLPLPANPYVTGMEYFG
jgi:hypothetical protein